MDVYSDIPKGRFRINATGLRTYIQPIIITLKPGKNEYLLEENTLLEKNHVIGLYVQPPSEDAGNKTAFGVNKQMASRAVFNSARISFREDAQTEVISDLPLSIIENANKDGRPFRLRLGKIYGSKTGLTVPGDTAAAAGDVIVVLMEYIKDK